MATKIRNFSIIAHIDHGKTTLTDALLRLTNTVTARDLTERMLDSNPIEQERGITIKLAPVRMNYHGYTLNLIDTPGHVDFGYEVSRSLAAGEGAVLLIDVSQGVQAQTLSNFQKAQRLGLTIIPVLNKIDLPTIDLDLIKLEVMESLGFAEEEILAVSAKTGQNVDKLLEAIIKRIPAPIGKSSDPLRALVITSQYDYHKGVVAYIRVVDGVLKKQKLQLLFTQSSFTPIEIGIFSPEMRPRQQLTAGEVGYLATGLKDIKKVKIGDTVAETDLKKNIKPLPGYQEPTPMVYMELYPIDAAHFSALKDSMDKLALHDSSLQYQSTHSQALGNGLRVGFLGILHAEIIRERLEREFDLELIATAPSVIYQISKTNGQVVQIHSPSEMPDPSLINKVAEPITTATIYSPDKYLSSIIQFINDKRGELINSQPMGVRTKLEFEIPLSEVIIDLHDKLKSLTSGYASLEYEVTSYKTVDAVKVNIVINREVVEALSFMTMRNQAEQRGRKLTAKLKKVIPRQLFEVPIQAAIGGKIVARETIKAYRKDVTAKLYGGDRTRRMKLLKKQAKGKKRLKQVGSIELSQEAFLAVLEQD
ncbi:translation elongation factor 4 [Patescibacteria group bacterium]|nr:translation elongation factor 4 [Patescibacteria group bacterium]MBU1885622.1 translation elongation factor 4 [Patescibacteria group bacterium]